MSLLRVHGNWSLAPPLFIVAAFTILLTGCGQKNGPHTETQGQVPSITSRQRAVADLEPVGTSGVRGTVEFIPEGSGMRVIAKITGLAPGDHGFHIHKKGDCSSPDASSAGPHFDPVGRVHGAPDGAEHHAGDLGNITADDSGNARLDYIASDLTFEGTFSIVGKALILHAGKDDLTSQPAGNSGPRVACGVIRLQE